MKLENRCLVPADRDTTWDLVMDIPRAAVCVPGVQDVTVEEEGRFKAVLKVRVGPISLDLAGTIQVLEQDQEKGEAHFLLEAADRRVGGGVHTARSPSTHVMRSASSGLNASAVVLACVSALAEKSTAVTSQPCATSHSVSAPWPQPASRARPGLTRATSAIRCAFGGRCATLPG